MKKLKNSINKKIDILSNIKPLNIDDRISEIKKTGRNISQNIEYLSAIISQESFIPVTDVKFRVSNMIKKWNHVEIYAKAVLGKEWKKLLNQEWVSASACEGAAFKTLLPMGVFLNITPATDNVGVALSTTLDLLLGGNPVILKPAAIANKGIFQLLEYFTTSLLNYVEIAEGGAENVIEVSIENENLYGVLYTGTSKAGEHIASVCGGKHVRYIGEYEGNNIAFVLDDFNPGEAANSVGHAVRLYNGLACACVHIAGIQKKNYKTIKADLIKFAGIVNSSPHDPSLPGTLLGPQLDTKLAAGCEEIIKKAVNSGSRLLAGGNRKGKYIEFTILEGFPKQISCEFEGDHCGHIYGPVLFIDNYDKILNWCIQACKGRRGYALRNLVLSNDSNKIMEISRILPSAIDTTNAFHFDSLAPWHGMKRSSTAPGAVHLLTEVVNTKYLFNAPKETILSGALI